MIDTHCHFVSARLSHNVSRCCKIASKRSGKRTTSLPFVGDTSRRYYGTMASVEICPTCGRPLRPQDARNRSIAEQYKAGQTIYGIARTFGMKPGAVHKVLTRRFGAEIVQQIYRERLADRNRKIWHTYQYERPPWPVFAERFNVSVITVTRIVRDMKRAHMTRETELRGGA